MAQIVALIVVAAGGAALVYGAGAFASAAAAAAPAEDVPDVVSIEADGYRYEYRVLSGTGYLWNLSVPERERVNEIRNLPEDAARMRRSLERRLRIDDLDVLHEPHRATADRLRELGYL